MQKYRHRLSAYRSNQHIYAQIIDDRKGHTLASADDTAMGKEKKPQEKAFLVGREIGKKAQNLNIEQVYFDRGKQRYHGQIKQMAEGARASGLKF